MKAYFIKKLFTAAAIIPALMLCLGCNAAQKPAETADSGNAGNAAEHLPVVTVTLPGGNAVLTPARTPSPTSEQKGEAVDYSSLDGVAEPGDVLPILTYDEAREKNSDVIGWLSVPGTGIDYPVVRTEDNEFYLNHNILKESSKHGAIFMDFRNADKSQQKHIILYGHDMKNGTMFHELMNFKQKSFFSENRIVSFNWDGTDTMWEIYLAATIPMVDGHRINYIETRFASNSAFEEYMADMAAYARTAPSSTVSDSIVIGQTDQVLTLTTCTSEPDGSRFVVQARRVR